MLRIRQHGPAGTEERERQWGGHGIACPVHAVDSMMNDRSARRRRPNSEITAGLRRLRLVLGCAAGLLLVTLAFTPGTAVAQAGNRPARHGHARFASVADAHRGTALGGALAHDLGRWAHAVRSPGLPPDDHDFDSERDSDSRTHHNTQAQSSEAAFGPPEISLRPRLDARHPLQFVDFACKAAPVSGRLARAPPRSFVSVRHAA